MRYIEAAKDELEADGGCVFCAVPEREPERVLGRGELAYVVLNKFPYNPGHLLIVPRRATSRTCRPRSTPSSKRGSSGASAPSVRNPPPTGSTLA